MWLKKLIKTQSDNLVPTPLQPQHKALKNRTTKEKTAKKKIGDWAEAAAKQHMKECGLKIKHCNYNCPLGEIDLIMIDQKQLVFVEVRFRKTSTHGDALESVSLSKQKKVVKTAQHYLQEKNLTDKISCRFDVIGIQKDNSGKPSIQWIKNAFY